MAQSSYPFENIDVSETQFSRWARNFQETGIKGQPAGPELLVTGDDSGLQVRVAAGQAFVRGHYYENTAQASVSLPSAGEQTRIDAIVLELSPVGNYVELRAVLGDPVNSSPVPPALTQTDAGIFQMLLAYVELPPNTTSVLPEMVTDERTFMSQRIGQWTTDTRPETAELNRIGYNATVGYHEMWNGTAWVALGSNVWTTNTRPAVPVVGLTGFNTTTLENEVWNGTQWVAVGGAGLSPFLLIGA
jgi:hypothetical protein